MHQRKRLRQPNRGQVAGTGVLSCAHSPTLGLPRSLATADRAGLHGPGCGHPLTTSWSPPRGSAAGTRYKGLGGQGPATPRPSCGSPRATLGWAWPPRPPFPPCAYFSFAPLRTDGVHPSAMAKQPRSRAPPQSPRAPPLSAKGRTVEFSYGPPGRALALPYRTELLAKQGLYRGLTPARRAA